MFQRYAAASWIEGQLSAFVRAEPAGGALAQPVPGKSDAPLAPDLPFLLLAVRWPARRPDVEEAASPGHGA